MASESACGEGRPGGAESAEDAASVVGVVLVRPAVDGAGETAHLGDVGVSAVLEEQDQTPPRVGLVDGGIHVASELLRDPCRSDIAIGIALGEQVGHLCEATRAEAFVSGEERAADAVERVAVCGHGDRCWPVGHGGARRRWPGSPSGSHGSGPQPGSRSASRCREHGGSRQPDPTSPV